MFGWRKSAIVLATILFAQGAIAADAPAHSPTPAVPLASLTAVDLPKPNFDVLASGFGWKAGVEFNSETIWRGISLTNHSPGGIVRGEVHQGWFYLGGDALNVTLPTSPTAQLDIWGGVRPAWGPLTLDFGAIYYGRPGNKNQWFLGGNLPVLSFWTPGALPTTPFDQSFVEIYGRPTWRMNEWLTVGADIDYDPNWAAYRANALYSGGNAKLSLPGTGFSLSGAFGHYFLGMGSPAYGPTYIQPGIKGIQGFKLSSYNTWNIGASYKINALTFDVRYSDTTLTQKGCFVNVANPVGNYAAAAGAPYSNWCEARVVGSVKVDFDESIIGSLVH